MTKIELREGYFIEVDEMNATLKQRYIGKDKNGNDTSGSVILNHKSSKEFSTRSTIVPYVEPVTPNNPDNSGTENK